MGKNQVRWGAVLACLFLVLLGISYYLLHRKYQMVRIAPIARASVGSIPIPSFRARRGVLFIEPLSEKSMLNPDVFKLVLLVDLDDVKTTLQLDFRNLVPSNWSTTDHGRSTITSYAIQNYTGTRPLLVSEDLKSGGSISVVDILGLDGEWCLSVMQAR
jgi:hypothetical protein